MHNDFIFDYNAQVFTFEGKAYSKETLDDFKHDILARANDDASLMHIYTFLQEWFNDSDTIEVQSSGSTGLCKVFQAQKKSMMESARRTCSFLSLKKGASVLLCMPLQFIGAKMIVVRALVAGLDLYCVPPSLYPMKDIDFSPDFVAMTPQQAACTLKHTTERKRLENVKHLILGGMAVMPKLEKELFHFPNAVWLTYGMAETLSHIALRRLNTKDASSFFTPFEGITVFLSDNECLCIDAPSICDTTLVTNDRAVVLDDGRFQILGRVDNVVNSGGIKIQIEEVEEKLSHALPMAFQLTSAPHDELGEQLVLLTETPCPDWKKLCLGLAKYQVPKAHILVRQLPLTGSGKPDRHTAKKIAHDYFLHQH